MGKLTTHVLDTANGRPGAGIAVSIFRLDGERTELLRTTTNEDGTQETVKANDLFYWPPGHNVKVDADAEIIMFSPQHEHSHVIDHMIKMVNG